MSDYSELKTAATRIIEVQTSQDVPISKLFDEFDALASPEAVLALIAEVEGLSAQHCRDSAELRSLCQARDDARKDRDQLKEEVARSTEREIMQLAEIEVLRKDAERYRRLRDGAGYCDTRDIPGMAPARMDEFIDAAITKGAKP